MWTPPDPKSQTPVSTQIADSVIAGIAAGRFAPGERLPSVRALAVLLLVNPNTVAKVYRELERRSIVVSRPGSGVTVAGEALEPCRAAVRDELERAARDLVARALSAGLDIEDVMQLIGSTTRSPVS